MVPRRCDHGTSRKQKTLPPIEAASERWELRHERSEDREIAKLAHPGAKERAFEPDDESDISLCAELDHYDGQRIYDEQC